MSLHAVMFYLVAFANLVSMLHLGLYMVGANTYDIVHYRNSKRKPKKQSEHKDLPLLSVIIPAHNEAKGIIRTVESVRKNSYPNIEIIVVDDGSHDRTSEIVREYIKQLPMYRTESYVGRLRETVHRRGVTRPVLVEASDYAALRSGKYNRGYNLKRRYIHAPTIKIRTVRIRQANAGKAAALNNAIANHAQGQFIMCLDADSILHPKAAERAMAYFDNPKVIGVAANVRIMAGKSYLTTVQRFEHMVGYRSKKFYSLTNSEFIIGGVASTFRADVLKRVGMYDNDTMTEDIGLSLKLLALEGNKNARIVYAADVVAMTEGVQTFKALLRQRYRWKMGCLQNLFKYRHLIGNNDRTKYNRMITRYRLPMALISETLLVLQPLLFAYLIYISINYRTLGIILGAYITITAYVLWTVWPDEHLTIKQKLRLSLTSLVIYGMFYIMDVVQMVAVFRCIRNYRSIIHRDTHVTWVSPARTGEAMAFSR
jgi:biofilm PGA synthesis N-glycosyltransferase PgaC